jgi:hypothetical protein
MREKRPRAGTYTVSAVINGDADEQPAWTPPGLAAREKRLRSIATSAQNTVEQIAESEQPGRL